MIAPYDKVATVDSASNQDPVFADERQAQIAELISVRGRVRMRELAKLFGVTEPTIRKDLTVLQDQGVLKRTHGGALALHPAVQRGLAEREATNPRAKQTIADACVRLLSDSDSVFLDSGTTVDAIARSLADHARRGTAARLSVLTNTLHVAERLADAPGIDCLLLGGNVRSVERVTVGPLTLEDLQRFTFSVAFIGASGLSQVGITVGNMAEAAVKSAVIECARRVVLPIDQSKIGLTDFARICEPDAIDTVVTDASTPAVEELCRSFHIELIEAGA